VCFSQQRRLTLAPTIRSWGPPQHLPLPHYLQPPRQAQTHIQTHTYTHGSHIPTWFCKKSHVTYSPIYIVLCVQFYACTITCTQLLYHTRSHSALRFLTAGGGRRSSPDPQGGPLCTHLRPRLVARTLISLEWFLHVTCHLG